MVTVEKLRPDIPPDADGLPGGAFAGLGEYVNLMKACWAQDATARPDFETIIGRLRRLLAVESLTGRGGSGVRRRPAAVCTQHIYGLSCLHSCAHPFRHSP